jgi:putative FmdB family regulatory protein
MPTYEYACKGCGEHLEVVQSFKDDPLTTCPHCEGELRKVFGSIGIAFKGSGFYKTDSRPAESSSSTPSSSSESTPSSTPSSSGEAASKPAASKPSESTPAASAS